MTQADQPPPPAPKPLPTPDPLAAEITQTLLALDAEENNTRFGDLLDQQARSGAGPTPPEPGAPARLDLSGILDQPDLQASLTRLLIENSMSSLVSEACKSGWWNCPLRSRRPGAPGSGGVGPAPDRACWSSRSPKQAIIFSASKASRLWVISAASGSGVGSGFGQGAGVGQLGSWCGLGE